MKKIIALSISLLILLTACTVSSPSSAVWEGQPSTPSSTPKPSLSSDSSVNVSPTEESRLHTYEITARLHEDMPTYRFVATGIVKGTDDWDTGFILGLDVYDENGMYILSEDFSYMDDGKIYGNYALYNMMDTMGMHVVDANFDGYRDVIIIKDFGGAHSNSWYDCWLWDVETASFAHSESFAAICNPAFDAELECIYSWGGSGVEYWGGSIYKYSNGEFILTNHLDGNWTQVVEWALVNGEMVIVREVYLGTGNSDEEVEQKWRITRQEQEYYANNELWQWDMNVNSRWYMYGGHHADKWLGG